MRYGRKARQQAAYGGRARQENLFGHKAGVRCLGLLPGRNLLVTGAPNAVSTAAVAAHSALRRAWWLVGSMVEALLPGSAHSWSCTGQTLPKHSVAACLQPAVYREDRVSAVTRPPTSLMLPRHQLCVPGAASRHAVDCQSVPLSFQCFSAALPA